MNKIKRFEVRLSEEEKKILEQIKLSTGKNISDVFREFLYSYDLDTSKKNLEKEINELELERDITIHNLYSVYSKIRKTYETYLIQVTPPIVHANRVDVWWRKSRVFAPKP